MFLLLCVVKLELTDCDPDGASKVGEILKKWFYQFHTPSKFSWLSRALNPNLLSPSSSLYHSGSQTFLCHCSLYSILEPPQHKMGTASAFCPPAQVGVQGQGCIVPWGLHLGTEIVFGTILAGMQGNPLSELLLCPLSQWVISCSFR